MHWSNRELYKYVLSLQYKFKKVHHVDKTPKNNHGLGILTIRAPIHTRMRSSETSPDTGTTTKVRRCIRAPEGPNQTLKLNKLFHKVFHSSSTKLSHHFEMRSSTSANCASFAESLCTSVLSRSVFQSCFMLILVFDVCHVRQEKKAASALHCQR